LGFDIVAARGISAMARLLGGRRSALLSIRELARKHGAIVIETNDVNGNACLTAVTPHAPEIALVLNFDQILRQNFINVPTAGVVNVHPSLLPDFRGPCPVFWAMAEGCPELGVTLHFIEDQEIDAGPVISQLKMAREPAMSVAEATSVLFVKGVNLFVRRLAEDLCHAFPEKTSSSSYHTFPSRAEVGAARTRGVRLCQLDYLRRLVSTMFKNASALGPS
jgi:methionyl-tRNA formyltransferase